ncbi:N alpha-acetyl-transferase [Sporothrix epigloea]|uniref:N-alpha-acetyltransferase 40 n=1 Tax=Sporothrix epigloea TaxID=1892477 RepID=A0ABP0DBR9_9PEZI
MAYKKRRRAATSPIDRALAKPDADFVKDYLEPAVPELTPWTNEWTHATSGRRYCIRFARPETLGERDLEACFRLIEETSRADYESSTMKWRPKHKRQEMRSPDLRYIVVQEESWTEVPVKVPVETVDGDAAKDESAAHKDGSSADNVASSVETTSTVTRTATIPAFTSLMPVYEEGEPVVYCYEIHLSPSLRGSGLGRLLLGFQSIIAHNLGPPVSKVMLTCFLSNSRALQFYKSQGFVTDELAPATRRLRGGKVFQPDYTILSKPVAR